MIPRKILNIRDREDFEVEIAELSFWSPFIHLMDHLELSFYLFITGNCISNENVPIRCSLFAINHRLV